MMKNLFERCLLLIGAIQGRVELVVSREIHALNWRLLKLFVFKCCD